MYAIKHISFSLLITGAIFLLVVSPSHAQTPTVTPTCQAVYGGGTNCDASGVISLNKTIENPQTNTYSNNLLQDAYIYGTSETVTFKLTITNTTTGDIDNIHIMDTLPANLDYVSSDGTFNSTNRTITIKDDKLTAKTAADYIVKAKVNAQPLPGNQSVACLSNTAQVQTTSIFFFNHTQSQDTSIFCIKSSSGPTPTPVTSQINPTNPSSSDQIGIQSNQTKGGQKVYTPPTTGQSPATGPEPLSLLFLPAFFLIGRKLRKVTK